MKSRLLAAVLVLAAARGLRAQSAAPDSVTLAPVVVTAHKGPGPLAAVTTTTTVLDARQLREEGLTHLVDALRRVPGMALARSGAFGAQASVFVRGGESDYTKVLVDGVPVNDPGGAVDLGALTLDEVERIEVVRGPGSVVHGSDAVSGVIHVITRDGRGGSGLRLEAGGGSRGASLLDAGGSARLRGVALAGGVARHGSRGTLPFNNRYANTVGSTRVVLTGATDASLALRHGDDTFHYPTDGAGRVEDHNARRVDRRTTAALEASRALGGRITARIAATLLATSGRTDDAPDSPADTAGLHAYRSRGTVRRDVVTSLVQVRLPWSSELVGGGEYARERQTLEDSSNYDPEVRRFDAARGTRAVFVEALAVAARWSWSLGARLDDNDVYGTFRTVRATTALALTTHTRLRAGAGSSFKAPSFFEEFSTAFTVGNADLRPERARSWELGLEHRRARLEASATWFDQRFRDLVQYTFISPTAPSYFNVAAARARGLEAQVNVHVTPVTTLRTGGTLLRTRVEDAGFDVGEGATFVHGARLLRRPSAIVTVGATTRLYPGATLDLQAARIGTRDDRDFSTYPAAAVTLAPYTRLDASLQVPLAPAAAAPGLTLVLRADNLLGARYSEVAGFAAPGRILVASVRARWGR